MQGRRRNKGQCQGSTRARKRYRRTVLLLCLGLGVFLAPFLRLRQPALPAVLPAPQETEHDFVQGRPRPEIGPLEEDRLRAAGCYRAVVVLVALYPLYKG